MKIRTAEQQDGTLTYLMDRPPSALPPVQGRDLEAAWDLAHQAARHATWSTGRAFRFAAPDGGWTDLALHDADAQCWAGAVDRAVGMQTGYGMSVCLRLLALVDLLGRAPWAARLMQLDRGGAALHPALLRLAAAARLTDDARFDEPGFHASLRALPSLRSLPGLRTLPEPPSAMGDPPP